LAVLSELAFEDATALAELVRGGAVGAGELVQATIERIEALNPQLNAIVTPMFEQAVEQAARFDRSGAGGPGVARSTGGRPRKDPDVVRSAPFAGVPFVVKDLIASCEGVRQTEGSYFLRDSVASSDSELVRRQRAAGLIIVGKTNTSELGGTPETAGRLFGATHNPWDPTLSPGGSSGGSAVAVAAGIVAMGHGNDTGGSIRNPASCCGVFGLKPSRGRMPLGPEHGDLLCRLLSEHALTRSVRDSARLLDATHGARPGDPYRAPAPTQPFTAALDAPRRLRIAVSTATSTGASPHPECAAAVARAARLCEQLGHEVDEAQPDFDGSALVQAWFETWAQTIAGMVADVAAVAGRLPERDGFEALTWRWYERGADSSASDHLRALRTLQLCTAAIAQLMESYDVWLTPTLGIPALPVGAFDSNVRPANLIDDAPLPAHPDAREQDISKYMIFSPYTRLANITGFPAMSVPLHQTQDGVPVGAHFMGRLWDEATLLSLAGQLEQAAPWRDARPAISCGSLQASG
jgi:amidase